MQRLSALSHAQMARQVPVPGSQPHPLVAGHVPAVRKVEQVDAGQRADEVIASQDVAEQVPVVPFRFVPPSTVAPSAQVQLGRALHAADVAAVEQA